MKKISTPEAKKQAIEDMKKAGIHPYWLYVSNKLIKSIPENTIRLGLVGL